MPDMLPLPAAICSGYDAEILKRIVTIEREVLTARRNALLMELSTLEGALGISPTTKELRDGDHARRTGSLCRK